MFNTYFISLTPTIWNNSRLFPKDKLEKLILIIKYSLTISIGIMCGFWIRRHLFKKLWILETHHIHRYMYSQCVLHIHNRQKNCHIGVGKFFMETGISPKRPLHPNSILRTDFNTEKFCHCYLLYCQFIHWSKFIICYRHFHQWLFDFEVIQWLIRQVRAGYEWVSNSNLIEFVQFSSYS